MRRATPHASPLIPGKPSKYRAQPIVIDGIRFASKAEARRYGELKLLEKIGQIRGLATQPSFSLHAHQVDGVDRPSRVGVYRGDFWYQRPANGKWETVIEDVKGFMTPLAKWKIKHVEAQYGIKVEIVR